MLFLLLQRMLLLSYVLESHFLVCFRRTQVISQFELENGGHMPARELCSSSSTSTCCAAEYDEDEGMGQSTAWVSYMHILFVIPVRLCRSFREKSEFCRCFGLYRRLLRDMMHLMGLPPHVDAPNHWSAIWLNTLPRWVHPTLH